MDMEVQAAAVVYQGLQMQAAGKSLSPQSSNVTAQGASFSFSVVNLAQTLKSAGIDPGSFQAFLHGNTIDFTLSQSGDSGTTRTAGTISLETKSGIAQVSTGGATISINVQALNEQAAAGDANQALQNLQKASQTILQEIKTELRQNPKADMAQLEASLVNKYAQPLGDVLRYLMNFLYQLGNQEVTLQPKPAAKA